MHQTGTFILELLSPIYNTATTEADERGIWILALDLSIERRQLTQEAFDLEGRACQHQGTQEADGIQVGER
jgi:hypothetical protein